MLDLPGALVLTAVTFPLLSAVLAAGKKNGRSVAILATAISLACVAGAALPGTISNFWLRIDSMAAAPALLFVAIMLAMFVTAPKRDSDGPTCAVLLAGMSGTLIVYTAVTLPVLLAGWLLSAAPVLKRNAPNPDPRIYARPAMMLLLSTVLFGCAVALIVFGPAGVLAPLAFGLAVAASLIRTGIFPFHSWVIAVFENGNMQSVICLASAQAGAFLILRLASDVFAEPARIALPFLGGLALFSTVFMVFMALGESAPRRILALVFLSQTGFIISGLELSNVPGITGALVHWLVVSTSTAGLLIILRALEVRCGVLLGQSFLGLAARAPRFAVFFLLFALALVGLPGTLGFCGEDLLFHGALEAHPVLGLALPIATATGAIRLLQLFSRLFLGKRGIHVQAIADSLPRERWVLTALAFFLVVGGLAPYRLIQTRIGPAQVVADVLAAKPVAGLR